KRPTANSGCFSKYRPRKQPLIHMLKLPSPKTLSMLSLISGNYTEMFIGQYRAIQVVIQSLQSLVHVRGFRFRSCNIKPGMWSYILGHVGIYLWIVPDCRRERPDFTKGVVIFDSCI